MKYFLHLLLFMIVSFVLGACSLLQGTNESAVKINTSPYLSITSTTSTEGKFVIHFYIYDLTTKKVEEVGQIPMTAQYPLGAIDRKNHTLYYSERDSSGSDQLIKLNLKTKQRETLTTNLFAINHIIPVDKKIILSTSPKGQRNIPLATYDLQSKKLILWDEKDHDTSVRSLTLNPFTGKLYASLYSEKERVQKSKKADIEQTTKVVPAVHRIAEYDIEGQMLREIYKAEEMVTLFSVSKDTDLALIRTAPTVFKERKLYLYNLKTGKKEVLKTDNYGAIEHAFFSPDNQGFFFTARENVKNQEGNPNALYYYHLQTGEIKQIFAKSGSYINNFMLVN
ncbi:WD40 repeat domain-containing protein [Aneurinibacillus aneurinilyticus]|uniref:WD40 repeat domain-containing protein n=1 Tax=Aneurinibacillus aneurinilyticus TaxID=1391 RepID=UPI002E20E6AF|nr:WD40 repeat domain-containing protein [Aneurinibacillus aneurinilyticus]